MISSQFSGTKKKKECASRFLTLLNVEIRETAESAVHWQTALIWPSGVLREGVLLYPGTSLHPSLVFHIYSLVKKKIPKNVYMMKEIKDYKKWGQLSYVGHFVWTMDFLPYTLNTDYTESLEQPNLSQSELFTPDSSWSHGCARWYFTGGKTCVEIFRYITCFIFFLHSGVLGAVQYCSSMC